MNNYQHISELENEVDYAADCEEIISHSHTVLFMEVILLQKVHCLPGSPHPCTYHPIAVPTFTLTICRSPPRPFPPDLKLICFTTNPFLHSFLVCFGPRSRILFVCFSFLFFYIFFLATCARLSWSHSASRPLLSYRIVYEVEELTSRNWTAKAVVGLARGGVVIVNIFCGPIQSITARRLTRPRNATVDPPPIWLLPALLAAPDADARRSRRLLLPDILYFWCLLHTFSLCRINTQYPHAHRWDFISHRHVSSYKIIFKYIDCKPWKIGWHCDVICHRLIVHIENSWSHIFYLLSFKL